MTRKSLAISMLGLVWMIGQAWGSTVIYCNQSGNCGSDTQAAFTTATSGLQFNAVTLTDGTYAAPGYTSVSGFPGLEFLGFEGMTAESVVVTGGVLQQSIGGGSTSIEIVLPPQVYAFSATISDTSSFALPCVEIASQFNTSCSGDELTVTSSSDKEFLGVAGSAPLSTVFIGTTGAGSAITITNLELGTEEAAPTPEVGTLLLIGTGLILMRFVHRRRERKPSGQRLTWRPAGPAVTSSI